MAITGPDKNSYSIPGLCYSNTFNVWKDITDTSSYKLNKLKVYSGVSSSNISASTAETEGVLSVTLMPTVTTGHTFSGVFVSSGGATFASTTDHTGAARFASTVAVVGGLSATALYASTGSTFASTLTVSGGATFSSTTDHAGVARFATGVTTSALDVTGISKFSGGATFASTTDHAGVARFATGVTTSALDVTGVSKFSGGATFSSTVAVVGGLSATALYASTGSTFASILNVLGGATFTSTTDHTGAARFASTVAVVGGLSASALYASTGSTFASTLNIGLSTSGATLGISGGIHLYAQSQLRFADADSTHWVGFRAPATVSSAVVWTLPAADGSSGQVLSTNGSSTLAWKAADGVTGSDKQIQFNIGGLPGATAGLVLEYNTAGYSAGTLGVSGGAYIMGNVGIGITTPAIGARIYDTNTTAKLEVRGDIRIPSGGFFVNKNITIPAGVCAGIGADENAFLSGVLTVASGATLSISTGGTLVIL